jgi:hypothetical protein
MLTIKIFFLLILSTLSFNTLAYMCQPSDAYGFEGYPTDVLTDGYVAYNYANNGYTSYQIVQNTPGDFQKEYWCIYESEALELNHMQSCDNKTSSRAICPVQIGGFINGLTNYKPYLEPLGECSSSGLCIDIPQTLTIGIGGDSTYDANTGISMGYFNVESNGWVDFEFIGQSYTQEGVSTTTPYFYKQEVNAAGDEIPGRYDHLITTLGVRVSDADLLKQLTSSTPSYNSWNLGSDHYGPEAIQPMGTPENFILPISNPSSPGATIGSFSPTIGGGWVDGIQQNNIAQVKIYALSSGNYTAQSGNYKLTVYLTVTARESQL